MSKYEQLETAVAEAVAKFAKNDPDGVLAEIERYADYATDEVAEHGDWKRAVEWFCAASGVERGSSAESNFFGPVRDLAERLGDGEPEKHLLALKAEHCVCAGSPVLESELSDCETLPEDCHDWVVYRGTKDDFREFAQDAEARVEQIRGSGHSCPFEIKVANELREFADSL